MNDEVVKVVEAYLASFPEDAGRLAGLVAAAAAGSEPVTARRTSPGHVTCGVVAVREPGGYVLQIRHRGLNRWLLPGGHVEPGDATLLDAATPPSRSSSPRSAASAGYRLPNSTAGWANASARRSSHVSAELVTDVGVHLTELPERAGRPPVSRNT